MKRSQLRKDWHDIIAALDYLISYETQGIPDLPDHYWGGLHRRQDAYEAGSAALVGAKRDFSREKAIAWLKNHIEYKREEIKIEEKELPTETYAIALQEHEVEMNILEKVILYHVENMEED